MPELATKLARLVNRPVVDQTGLAGVYDVDLEFVPATSAAPGGDFIAPALMRALHDQLGLTLEKP